MSTRDPSSRVLLVRVAAGVAGAALVLRASWSASQLGTTSRLWATVAVIALSVALAWVLPELRRLLPRPGDAPLVMATTLAVSFLCVPETDQVPGVAIVVMILVVGEGLTRARVPIVVLGLMAAYVMWAGVFGATGRQSALVGTLVAWWPVVILPLLTWWRPALASSITWAKGTIVVIGAAAAAIVARTGALEPTVAPAFVATAVAVPVSLLAAAAVAVLATRVSARPAPPPR